MHRADVVSRRAVFRTTGDEFVCFQTGQVMMSPLSQVTGDGHAWEMFLQEQLTDHRNARQ